MRTVLGIYQAIDPQHPLRAAVLMEAFAINETDTIRGRMIVHATNCKSTGTSTFFSQHINDEGLRLKAEDAVQAYFKSAIEPYDGERWTLTIYESGKLEAIHSEIRPSMDDAILTGRRMLNQLANRTTMRQLEVDQWFSFEPTQGDWAHCYKAMGNGWYGRAYSGGPWHKADDTQVFVLSDELQALCNKQEQALHNEYRAVPKGWESVEA